MTEEEREWLSSSDAGRMIGWMPLRAPALRRTAFMAACLAEALAGFGDAATDALLLLERLAGGAAPGWEEARERRRQLSEAVRAVHGPLGGAAWVVLQPYPTKDNMIGVVNRCLISLAAAAPGTYLCGRWHPADLLREVFGNPFRPVAFAPGWRTSTAVALAATTYDAREFDRLPVLADALEDAGCDNAAVLAHCRAPGPHVRGCWVVDLVLGKA